MRTLALSRQQTLHCVKLAPITELVHCISAGGGWSEHSAQMPVWRPEQTSSPSTCSQLQRTRAKPLQGANASLRTESRIRGNNSRKNETVNKQAALPIPGLRKRHTEQVLIASAPHCFRKHGYTSPGRAEIAAQSSYPGHLYTLRSKIRSQASGRPRCGRASPPEELSDQSPGGGLMHPR